MDETEDCISQAAAIPIRDGRICLVSSRSGRRWVIPKGHIEAGHSPNETALIESWEEAGLVGEIVGGPVGAFTYFKLERIHHVTVFVMNVTHEAEKWPERNQRRKVWLNIDDAAERVSEPDLRAMILQVAEQLLTTL
jgi:8-oxo-dGTP pyrophosphatase MutT (NUDIX family)